MLEIKRTESLLFVMKCPLDIRNVLYMQLFHYLTECPQLLSLQRADGTLFAVFFSILCSVPL